MNKLLELLKKLGASEEDIEAAKSEIESDKEADVAGLKKKRDELLAENRKLKNGGNEDAAKLAEENAKLQEQLDSQAKELKKSGESLKKLEADKAKVEQEFGTKLAGEQAAINRLLVEEGLTKGITQIGITKPAQVAAVRALLKEKGILSVEAEGDVRKAVAKLMKDGKETKLDLDAYLKDWATSEEGKEFVPAAQNQGGGAGGGTGKG